MQAGTHPASGLGVWERTSGVPAPPLDFDADAIDNLVSLEWTPAMLGPAATGYTLEVDIAEAMFRAVLAEQQQAAAR